MKTRLYILNGPIEEKLENLPEIEKEDILISSDEISSFKINYIPIDKDANCSVRKNISFEIKGKIIAEVTDSEKKKSDFYINNNEFNNAWNQIPQNYYEDVKKLIHNTYSNLDISPESLSDNVTNLNSRNLLKLKYWMDAFFKIPKRTVILEIINNNYTDLHILENAYAYSLEEKGTIEQGNGEFNLVIKQQKSFNKKHMIYSSDGNIKPEITSEVEISDPKSFKGKLSGSNFSLNGIETPLVAGTGLVGAGLISTKTEDEAQESIDICLFDVNDAHVQFLLGKSPATMVYKSTITQETHKELYSFLNSKETLFVGYKRNLQPLFSGMKRELTRRELENIENINISKPLSIKDISNLPLNPYGYDLWARTIESALASNIFSDNSLNALKLNIVGKLKGTNSVLEEDYFIYKIEKKDGKYLLIGMSKDIHYGRNKYQDGKIPTNKKQLQSVEKNDDLKVEFGKYFKENSFKDVFYFESKKIFYKRLGILQSLYHGTENEKFVSISPDSNLDGLFEVVFDFNGNIVLEDESLGTFNFYGPNKAKAHTMYDVIPYWLWGNTKADKNTLSDRMVASDNLKKLLLPTIEGIFVKNVVLFKIIENLFKK